jgi:hypothetical protein
MDYHTVDTPIILKTYELYKTFYRYLELFPKKDKYLLGAKCEGHILEILEILLEANYLPKDKKLPLIQRANNKFEVLKILIRLIRELDIIDQKKYIVLQTIIQDIGKMFGGWLRSLQ